MELTTTFDNELRKMNRLMDRWFHMGPTYDDSLASTDWVPRVDIAEDEKAYMINVELPEVKKENVKIHIEDGVLTISGERRQEKETKQKKYHRMERSYGSFLRTFTLPAGIDETKVRSRFADGMLEVVLPKSGEVKRLGKDIPIG